ncbi:DUF2264 domain-containing protein [Hymenobacter terrenus]|uniref:DUF2264 domain-containing protein n=1 Tax=Hymenobacter terrenus TaxID=1629124 RepID=UPI0018CF535E|nr:DUF2264 domain-containing protein [Hymenobacter terrenus]
MFRFNSQKSPLNAVTQWMVLCALLCAKLGYPAQAQPGAAAPKSVAPVATSTVFKVVAPDFKTSPLTGMTRRHWQDAARYLLTGAFSYVRTLDDPLIFPKQPGRSYPHNNNDAGQVRTAKFEGLCRTLFIAMPLLKEDPSLTINGIKIGDYYRHQIGQLLDPASPTYIRLRPKEEGQSQTLVEFGGLAVSLFAAPEILWDPLSKAQKDALAATMLSYGDGPTVPSNWRFFNIFVLSFFKSRGYAINEPLLDEYLKLCLEAYRGAGWYSDNGAYDYYSMWAFQVYGTLWSQFYGQKYSPQYAQQFTAHLTDARDNYPYMFSRNGEMIMWGRSMSYRFGSVAPFPLMGLNPAPGTNFGWLRRISSGAMLQFLQNPAMMQDQVPTLGFYGPYEPVVQAYNCRGSVYWMGKAFLGLLVPANSPFWTATENEGPWAKELKPGTVANRFQPGSNILLTDYPNSGAAEIRARCNTRVAGQADPYRANENYNRLSYNSAFPWQADGPNGEVAMNYVFQDKAQKWHALNLYTFRRFENDVYYRDAVPEADSTLRLRLADIPLPNGILRVDQVTGGPAGTPLRLGHYALPAGQGPVRRQTRKVKGYTVHLLDNGTYQLALVPLRGWESVQVYDTKGLHPASAESAVINASGTLAAPSARPALYATLLLWKKSGTTWTDAELLPVTKLAYPGPTTSVQVQFADGSKRSVDFK